MKLGIVVSRFNEKLTTRMRETAEKHAEKRDIIVSVLEVPGAYDIPYAVQKLLDKGEVDGVVTLGVIVKGSTDHDVLIATSTATALTNLSLHYKKPVSLGIIGPEATWEQADKRVEEYAKRAVDAAFDLLQL